MSVFGGDATDAPPQRRREHVAALCRCHTRVKSKTETQTPRRLKGFIEILRKCAGRTGPSDLMCVCVCVRERDRFEGFVGRKWPLGQVYGPLL